jgi:multicomponent Na+:H+ antiporter subunit C
MGTLLALVVGVLFAAGVYLLLDGNLVRAVFGLVLMSNAANLLFFTAGRVMRGTPPLIPVGMEAPEGVVANPLAQALVLTAIVIGFGLISFALVLVYRYHRTFGTVEAAPGGDTTESCTVGGASLPVRSIVPAQRRQPAAPSATPVAAFNTIDPEPTVVPR